ncbi:MAG: hypothetical protein ACREJS_16540, partial [Candidatus Rokuibacteriota bacterium]
YEARGRRARKEARRRARLVAAAIPGSRVTTGDIRVGVDLEVVVGRRFRTRRIIQIDPIPLPRPGSVPKVCREEA